jgi:tetratricopeptide (TPR) repeat protein
MQNAIRDFAEATRLTPDSESAHYNLARALLSVGRNKEAIEEFRKVLKLNPKNEDARRTLSALGGG